MQIENLSPAQVQMLDQMWACKSTTEYRAWYSILTAQEQIMANMLQQLVLMETLEDMLTAESANYKDTRNYLKKFML